MLKSGFLECIFTSSAAKAIKCLNRGSWSSFCRLPESKPESAQIESPETHFVDFWRQRQKMLKSKLLELILSTSGAKAIKCLNRSSWSSFCRFPEPKPDNAQIASPGKYFEDFSIQGHKMLKSSLLELILSTSGAKALTRINI